MTVESQPAVELPFSSLDAALCPGHTLLGKYRVERVLGRGGMGVVVAARHLELGELFAIKLLDAVGFRSAPSRFLREAQAAARMRSEHAVRVFDVGRLDDGTLYLVMEYLDGEDLAALLARRGRLPLAEAVPLVLDACDALAEAHALGIVHRDLKLANLFVCKRRDGRPQLKVIDFGISKVHGAAEPLTGPGVVLGSPAWMPPEQFDDAQAVDGRCDIWALGVALYQLVTGAPPFAGTAFTDVLRRVLFDEPEPPSQRCRDLPTAVDDVVARCLRKQPADRYADIAALAAAVRALAHPAEPGPRTVTVHFERADPAILADPDRCLRWLCVVITRQLARPLAPLADRWDAIFDGKANCTAYLEQHLLPAGPLVLVLDHIDHLYAAPATAEAVFSLLRAWHDLTETAPAWSALRLVLTRHAG